MQTMGPFLSEIHWIGPTAKRFNNTAQGKRAPPWVGGWGRIVNPERVPQPLMQPLQS